MASSLGANYFHEVYERSDDPWEFATSAYERAKYDDTLRSLTRPLYPEALEIGCSVGVFTERLAPRCGQLLATDVSSKALAAAQIRCQRFLNVHFEQVVAPPKDLLKIYDLIVMSEVGYYWSLEDLGKAADEICDHLSFEGQLILVHWLPFVEDYPLTGDEVHNYFLERADLRWLDGHRHEEYRLDLFRRA